MAQFTAQGRLKPLFNGDGMPVGFEHKDPSHNHHRRRHRHHHEVICSGSGGLRFTDAPPIPFQHRKRNVRLDGSTTTRLFASSSSSSSSSSSKSSSSMNKSKYFIDDLLDEPDYESDELSCFRGLVLDISYRPINVVCWKRAICLEFMEKVDVLEYYDQTVNSPSGSFYIPAVLRVPHLLQVVKRRRKKNTLSRKNILARDSFTCQYCSSSENLTIDHVLPIARGGEWTWDNLVTACFSCNSRKGQKTLEAANMKLIKLPKPPKDYDIVAIPLTNTAIKMLRMRKETPEEWLQYLSKPSSEP